jgi:branched-chain amino acid transport system permease protein
MEEEAVTGLPTFILFQGFDLISFLTSFINFFALYLAISLSLNLEFGYAGVPNFGKVLFIAGGASVSGSISGRVAAYVLNVPTHGDFIVFNTRIMNVVDGLLPKFPWFTIELFALGLLIGAAVGAIFGFLASYPAIRLREDYLGMLLLGVAQFYQVVLRTYTPLTGGAQNIEVPDPYFYFISLGTGYRDLIAAAVVSVFAIAVFLYAERVARSPLGRTLKAVRESEDAARSLGKNDVKIRRNVLIVSSAIAGVAGTIFTFYIASVEYDTWTRITWTFWPFLIVIIGGVGNNYGVALGALFFSFVYKGLQQIQPYLQPYLFFDANWLQDLLFASLLIIILMLRPEGILREKSAPTLPKSTLRTIIGSGGEPAVEHVGESEQDDSRFARLKRVILRRSSKPPPTGDGESPNV